MGSTIFWRPPLSRRWTGIAGLCPVLVGQFEQPRAEECVARLERLPSDTPCHDRADYRKIGVPTVIVGNHQDPIHPWTIAETLAQIIPGAELRE